MSRRNGWRPLILSAIVILAAAGSAAGARLRYHYVPADAAGRVAFKPGPCAGEHISAFGIACDNCPPRPNCWKPFRHPCTGQTLVVPLALPAGTPIIYHKTGAVMFNYGSYFVEVRFLPDGSVDVIYSSGLLREI